MSLFKNKKHKTQQPLVLKKNQAEAGVQKKSLDLYLGSFFHAELVEFTVMFGIFQLD